MTRNNSQAFRQAWREIENAEEIFLTTHEGTDGDDLGSLLAMRLVLERLGKRVYCQVKGGVPHSLQFLPGSHLVSGRYEPRAYDLAVTFGCNVLSRTGFPELAELKARKINFDHHPDNQRFADVNVVDETTAAVAELVFYFLRANPAVDIDKDAATCLLTGIFTDTGGFKHSNTTSEVYAAAAELLKKGARIDRIAKETFGHKRPQALRAWSKALDNARFDPEKRMVFSVMTGEDMAAIQAEDEDLGGFVEMLNHMPQAKFALLLRQDGDTVKGSLRSDPHKNTDVSKIAKVFGGGGHKYASGFKIKGRLARGPKGWEIIAR